MDQTGLPGDAYDRLYYYDLELDSDSDRQPDWMEEGGDRPPATLLTPSGGTLHRRNPDMYDTDVVYEVWNGSTSTIRYATVPGGEQQAVIGTGNSPRIGKYGATYFVAWQNGSSVYYRALPSGNQYSFTGSSPDIGYRYLVYQTATGIRRTDLSLYNTQPTNSSPIPGTDSLSKMPCTDHKGDYLAYLQGLGGGVHLRNRLYVVPHNDLPSAVLISGTTDVDAGAYAISASRPSLSSEGSNTVVFWHFTGDDGRGEGIAVADVGSNANNASLGDDNHLTKAASLIHPSAASSNNNWFSVASAGDRIAYYHCDATVDPSTAVPCVELLRNNLHDDLGGPPASPYPLLLRTTSGTAHTWQVTVYVRNLTGNTWTAANCRLVPAAKTPADWPGRSSLTEWPLLDYWGSTSEYHTFSGPSVGPGHVAAFSWSMGPAPASVAGPPAAGHYAFDWAVKYNGVVEGPVCTPGAPAGPEGHYVLDLLKVRQDLTFRSFLDVDPTDALSGYIEACAYHWMELGKDAIVKGYGDATFRPDDPVTRRDMCRYVYRADQSPPYTPPAQSPFTDVLTDDPAYKEICYCYDHGIVRGYGDGTFRPNDSLTRGMAATYLRRALGGGDGDYIPSGGVYYYTDVDATTAFHDAIYWMAEQKHLVDRYPAGTAFSPTGNTTRAVMCEFTVYGYRLTLPTEDFVYPWYP